MSQVMKSKRIALPLVTHFIDIKKIHSVIVIKSGGGRWIVKFGKDRPTDEQIITKLDSMFTKRSNGFDNSLPPEVNQDPQWYIQTFQLKTV